MNKNFNYCSSTGARQRKIQISVLLLLFFCLSPLVSAPCGDVNSDEVVDIVDALLIAQDYVNLNPANYDSTVADVNGDGNTDIVDALLVAQYYVHLIGELNCGEPTLEPTLEPTPDPTPDPTATPTVDPSLPIGPEGYIYCADEGVSVTFEVKVHVAFGADGHFNFQYNFIVNFSFDIYTFGDTIYGTVKHVFYL